MIRANIWTQVQKDELADHLRAGMSAGQIADRFPGRTRNAIIGLVHRDPVLSKIGLKGAPWCGGSRPRKDGAVKSVSIAAQRHKNVRGGKPKKIIQPVPRCGEVIPMKPRPKPEPKPVRPDYVAVDPVAYDAAALVVGGSPVSKDHCKWPIGDPKAEGFGFCGHLRLEGKPYCEHHRMRATRIVFKSEAAA